MKLTSTPISVLIYMHAFAAVVAGVEEAKKRMDVAVQMMELRHRITGTDIDLITPTRQLVREGPLRYVQHTHDKLRLTHVFLFNDLLVVTHPRDENNVQANLKFKFALPLSSLIMHDLPPAYDDGTCCAFFFLFFFFFCGFSSSSMHIPCFFRLRCLCAIFFTYSFPEVIFPFTQAQKTATGSTGSSCTTRPATRGASSSA